MTLSRFHDPPRAFETSHTTMGEPPLTWSRFNLPAAKNATDRLSADQNGYDAPSVPGRGLAASELNACTNSIGGAACVGATNAIWRPSGEIANVGIWP